MKFSKKRVLRSIALAAVISLTAGLFTGCSNDGSKDEQGRTIVSVSGWPTQGNSLEVKNARKARFEEANPDVVIEPSEWKFDRKSFYSKAAGGQLPIVYNVGITEMAEIMESEYSADLTDVLKKRGYDGKFNEKLMQTLTKDGSIYAFPYSAYLLGLGFNADMLNAAGLMAADGTPMQPKDWNEVAEFAVKIKEATGKPGIIFPSANGTGGWMFTCLAWSFGVDFMEQNSDGQWQATFNTPEAATALQYIKDLKWKYDVVPSNTLADLTEYYKQFATGNAGMLMAPGNLYNYVAKYGMEPSKFGMMAMPEGPERHVTLFGGNVWCVSPEATDEQIDAAIRWIEVEYNYDATDEIKARIDSMHKTMLEENKQIGVKGLSVWSEGAESLKYEHSLIDKMTNVNPNYVKLYNEFVKECPADIQLEEPVCCQELYAILDGCIQEVLSNENADCVAVLEKANSDFQANYLDNLTY